MKKAVKLINRGDLGNCGDFTVHPMGYKAQLVFTTDGFDRGQLKDFLLLVNV